MKSYLLDTNSLISFVVERIPEQTTAISSRFESAFNLECDLIVTPHVLSEFVFVLTGVYGRSDTEVSKMINDLLDTPGIRTSTAYNAALLFELWPQAIKDYGDAFTAMVSLELDTPILTFDKDFIKQLKRKNIPCEKP